MYQLNQAPMYNVVDNARCFPMSNQLNLQPTQHDFQVLSQAKLLLNVHAARSSVLSQAINLRIARIVDVLEHL